MQNIDKIAQQKMQAELQKYYKDNTSAKSYFQSMKEITAWLQGLVKS
jgi:hypothetical protein